jgi:hypothetical protein
MGKSTLRLITLETFKIISKELVQAFRPVKKNLIRFFFQIFANVISPIVSAAFTRDIVRGSAL